MTCAPHERGDKKMRNKIRLLIVRCGLKLPTRVYLFGGIISFAEKFRVFLAYSSFAVETFCGRDTTNRSTLWLKSFGRREPF